MADPVTILRPDGRHETVKDHVRQAFAGLARGDASSAQQKQALAYMIDLLGTFSVNPIAMPPEARAYTDGARCAGIAICMLAGGPKPFLLKRLGDPDSAAIDVDGHE